MTPEDFADYVKNYEKQYNYMRARLVNQGNLLASRVEVSVEDTKQMIIGPQAWSIYAKNAESIREQYNNLPLPAFGNFSHLIEAYKAARNVDTSPKLDAILTKYAHLKSSFVRTIIADIRSALE